MSGLPRCARVLLVVALAATATACTSDGPAQPAGTTTPPSTDPGAAIEGVLLTASDLPAGFEPAAGDDTITSFCAGQDAAAGLRASQRAVAAFARQPAGASVIQVALRLEDDGAQRFVDAARTLLDTCSEVPDATGLAFTYEAVSAPVAEVLEAAPGAVSGYGTSVGSGSLTVEIAVAHRGDVALLVAVLGVDQARTDLDALAVDVFAAAVARLPAP